MSAWWPPSWKTCKSCSCIAFVHIALVTLTYLQLANTAELGKWPLKCAIYQVL